MNKIDKNLSKQQLSISNSSTHNTNKIKFIKEE